MGLYEEMNPTKKEVSILQRLERMCHQKDFDRKKAVRLIKQVDVNQEFQSDRYSWKTTVLLAEVEKASNIPMAELLLQNGADPNIWYGKYESSPFCSLQFEGVLADEDDEERLQMAQRFLDYGANPLIYSREGGSLFDYVVYSVFTETAEDYDEDHLIYHARFLILLVAYGASSDYCAPCVTGVFDKTDMSQYEFAFLREGDAISCGMITDRAKNIIAQLPSPKVDYWDYCEEQRLSFRNP